MAMAGGMVIVGAGECGARAAFALRENGFTGPVTLIGDEVHLPYERPPLSKAAMIEGETPAGKWITDAARLDASGIELRRGVRVQSIDRAAKRLSIIGDGDLPYDKLLLATGAVPRRLMRDGAAIADIAYLRT